MWLQEELKWIILCKSFSTMPADHKLSILLSTQISTDVTNLDVLGNFHFQLMKNKLGNLSENKFGNIYQSL